MSTIEKIMSGDNVLVSYPPSDGFNNPAKKYHGQEFIVKDRRRVSVRGGDRTVYELYGAVSDMGIPYYFLEDELVKL